MKQWLKNGIVFLPMFFGRAISTTILIKSIVAFFAFSFLASSIYIINDIADIEKDKMHPVKCKRPLASGTVGKSSAVFVSFFLLICGYVLTFKCCSNSITLLWTSFVYWMYYVLNLFYTFRGKHIPLLDVVILASGFLLRLFFGSFVTNIVVSKWLYMVIMFGAFYLGLGKRRNELKKISNSNRGESRAVLQHYTYSFLDKNMYLCMALTIMFYSLWCADYTEKGNMLIFTIPLVLILAMKYSLSVENEDSEGDPTDVILEDKVFIILGILLIVALIVILYIL